MSLKLHSLKHHDKHITSDFFSGDLQDLIFFVDAFQKEMRGILCKRRKNQRRDEGQEKKWDESELAPHVSAGDVGEEGKGGGAFKFQRRGSRKKVLEDERYFLEIDGKGGGGEQRGQGWTTQNTQRHRGNR